MAQTTVRTAARRQIPVSAHCQAGVEFSWPRAHQRCRGNGPLYVPPFTAPVLPAEECGCTCHTEGGGAR